MATPEDLAEKIAKKAADVLSPLQTEMDLMKWPAEFRAIVWGAVAHHASILKAEEERKR